MKKIAFASVATLGILGTAVVPAFGATSLTQSQQQSAQISAAANIHCKVRHWKHRRGFRDAIRGDAFAGRKGHVHDRHKRHRFDKEIDFERNDEDNLNHHENSVLGAGGKPGVVGGHHRHHKKPRFDIDVDRHDRRHRRHHNDSVLLAQDAGRIAQRWDERKRWGTEKWCRGKRPKAGVAAGGGWHAKSKRK